MMQAGRMLFRILAGSALLACGTTQAATPGIRVLPTALQGGYYAELAHDLARNDPLQALAALLNRRLALPVDIGLRYAECGEAGAFYETGERRISLCLEMVERLAEDFSSSLDDDADLAEAVTGAIRFIVLHEVGHALVDVLELPITGREEDAVDQLSAWLLIGDEAGDAAVLSAAAAFAISGESHGLGESDFANEHSLDQQRYFSMVCWVYGRDPARHADLVGLSGLPPARAEGCAAEYARLDASWRRLLGERLKAPRPPEAATKE
jgi:hypothetical protein